MQIMVSNEQNTIRLNIKKIQSLVKRILKALRLPPESSLSIIFLSRARIKELNRRYLRRNRVTDVIAFGYREALGHSRAQKCTYTKSYDRIIERAHPASWRKHVAYRGCLSDVYQDYLGDIVICPSVALENSQIYHNDFYKELFLYIIHGILHLQGYTDTDNQKRLKMQRRGEEVLRKVLKR